MTQEFAVTNFLTKRKISIFRCLKKEKNLLTYVHEPMTRPKDVDMKQCEKHFPTHIQLCEYPGE